MTPEIDTSWLSHIMPSASYVLLAVGGGIARYLHSYIHSGRFSISLFIASAMMSGFSGLMFAYVGISLQMPSSILYVFSGIGGFMGHSALEFLAEFVKAKIKP